MVLRPGPPPQLGLAGQFAPEPGDPGVEGHADGQRREMNRFCNGVTVKGRSRKARHASTAAWAADSVVMHATP